MSLLDSFIFSAVEPLFLSAYTLPFTKPEFYVWAFCVGFNLTMIFTFILKGVESAFVAKLFELNAIAPDSAVTIGQANTRCKFLLKFLLRDKSTLRSVILLAKDESNTKVQNEINSDTKSEDTKIDFDNAKFYINEEKIKRAESLKKGAMKWYWLPIVCAVSVGLAIGICYLIPIFQNW